MRERRKKNERKMKDRWKIRNEERRTERPEKKRCKESV